MAALQLPVCLPKNSWLLISCQQKLDWSCCAELSLSKIQSSLDTCDFVFQTPSVLDWSSIFLLSEIYTIATILYYALVSERDDQLFRDSDLFLCLMTFQSAWIASLTIRILPPHSILSLHPNNESACPSSKPLLPPPTQSINRACSCHHPVGKKRTFDQQDFKTDAKSEV